MTEKVRLEPTMTALNGATVIVGTMIGSGIFIAPTGVVKHVGSYNAALIIWVTSGIYCTIGAYCFTELGCMIPKSGGDYIYVRETFGPIWAFFRLWIELIVIRPGATAIISLTFGFYSAKPFFPECDPPDHVIKIHAILAILLLTFVQCWSTKWTVKVQDFFTFAKVLCLLILIAAGIYQLCQGKIEYFTWENTNPNFASWALSYYSGLFSYNSWNYLNFLVNEMINPVRDLPIAIGAAMTITMAVYTLTNIAFYTTLSPEKLLNSVCVADTFARMIFGNYGWIIPLFVSLSTFGAINGKMFTSSRLIYAAALNNEMPHVMCSIQTTLNTPVPATIAYTAILLIYMAIPSRYILELINYSGFVTWFGIGCTVLCVIVLRKTQPDWERPIKVHLFFPIVYVIATIFITFVPIIKGPIETGIGILMIATTIPVYYIFVRSEKPMWFYNMWNAVEKFTQKLFVCREEDKIE